MKTPILLILILFSIFTFSKAQNPIIIEHIDFHLKTSKTCDSIRFPLYSQNELHQKMIIDSIIHLIGNKHSSEDISFRHSKKINLRYQSSTGFLTKYMPKKALNDTIHYAIRTTLKTINDEAKHVSHSITTEILSIQDSWNKYRYVYKIPFYFEYDIYGITDKTMFSEKDFINTYLESITLCLKNEGKKAKKRKYIQPTAKKYKSFIDNAECFALHQKSDSYQYGPVNLAKTDIIKFYNLSQKSSEITTKTGNTSVPVEKFSESWYVNNVFDGKSYEFYLTCSRKNTKYKSKVGEVDIIILSKSDSVKTKLKYSTNDELISTGGEKEIKIKYNPSYNTSEFFIDNTLYFVINEKNLSRSVYIHNTCNEEMLSDFINLLLAYDLSLGMQQQIYSLPTMRNDSNSSDVTFDDVEATTYGCLAILEILLLIALIFGE